MEQLEDSKIISLFFARSEQAVDELSRKYGPAVRNTAGNVLRDRSDVEERANDTYRKVRNCIPPHTPDPLGSCVCRIARNPAINRYHANRAEKRDRGYEPVLDEMEECIPSGMSAETEAKELTDRINGCLSTLGEEDRFLFVRRYRYAEPVSALAGMTGGSPNRISLRLFRIREKLKKTLISHDEKRRRPQTDALVRRLVPGWKRRDVLSA